MQIHTIDLNFRGQSQCIAAFLLECGSHLALIETGPESTAENLEAGIRKLGFQPADVRKVLVTHVHLDHAGAAGWWAQQGAQIYVHERGARHLVDPSKLITGARMVYGDQLEALWGEVRPIPQAQVTALSDGDTVEVGATTIRAWDTPGHARHHHAFVVDGVAFTGDVAGVRLPGQTYISPATAPSQFEPEPYVASIRRLAEAKFDALYLTHFGEVRDVTQHLERYEPVIRDAAELVRERMKTGASREDLVQALTDFNRARAEAENVDETTWCRCENANPTDMCADGIALYWQRQES